MKQKIPNELYELLLEIYNSELEEFELYDKLFDAIEYDYEPEHILVRNQCDGCMTNVPSVNGIHHVAYPNGSMICQKDKYIEEE